MPRRLSHQKRVSNLTPKQSNNISGSSPSSHRKATFHKGEKIPEECYEKYSKQLFLLIPKIRKTRQSFQSYDLFNNSKTERTRIILKPRHSYLFPDFMRKKFSQTYESVNKVHEIQSMILNYFNSYFFSTKNSIQDIDLSIVDGEKIFLGEVNLLVSLLKESLRRLSSQIFLSIPLTPLMTSDDDSSTFEEQPTAHSRDDSSFLGDDFISDSYDMLIFDEFLADF